MLAHRITERVFGIDPRSLSAFRIGLGLLLVADLGLRARDLVAHYTDAGAVPREVLRVDFTESWRWSLHLLAGTPAFQAALFAVAAVLAVMMILGSFTRWATIGSWILLTSLHVRNPLVLNGGDSLLRVLLFWSIFLPLDEYWSLAARRRERSQRRTIVSTATAAILLQVLLMYFMSGYFKLQGGWLAPDTLRRVLQTDSYAKPLAYQLVEFPNLLAPMSSTVMWSELVIPIIALSPIGTKFIRMFAVVWFGLFHLGIELTLTVGLFSYVSWVAWILFVPTAVWDRLTRGDTIHVEPVSSTNRHGSSRPTQSLVCALLALVLWLNLAQFKAIPNLPDWGRRLANLTGLRQRWSLFPYPPKNDGWYVAVARLADDRPIDLLREGEDADWDSYRKPRYIYRQFPNHRWRKYYRRLVSNGVARYRTPLCRYLAREWNHSHPADQRVVSLELHYMQELSESSDADGEQRFRQRFLCTIDVES